MAVKNVGKITKSKEYDSHKAFQLESNISCLFVI